MGLLERWDERNQRVLEEHNELDGGTWEAWNERYGPPAPGWLWVLSGLPWVGLIVVPVALMLEWRRRRRRSAGGTSPPSPQAPG